MKTKQRVLSIGSKINTARILSMLVLTFFGLCGGIAWAQTQQVRYVQTMSGARHINGSMVGFTAGGEAVSGINRDMGGSLQNYAGFLTSLVLRPDLDHDQDGLCDEVDFDNDNDGLEDAAEILGSWFDPATATDPNNRDTDGDGLSDGAEYTAGTDPANNASVLAITGIRREGGAMRVSWTGGTSARQILMRRMNLADPEESWVPILSINPPTLTTISVDDFGATNRVYYYKIEIERP
jgi:hypothetical protein